MNDTSFVHSARQVGAKGEQEGGVTMVTIAMRLSGLALVAAALVLGAMAVLGSLGRPGPFYSPLVSLLALVGALLLLLALPGMYARQAEAAGWLGLVGYVGLSVGNVLFIGFAAGPLFNPSLTGLNSEISVAAFVLGLALLLGLVLTAAATLRAAVYPRWAGILLLAAFVGSLLGFFVAWALPPLGAALIDVTAGATLALALAWIGVALWRGAGQRAL
jgi:hypothetical protein